MSRSKSGSGVDGRASKSTNPEPIAPLLRLALGALCALAWGCSFEQTDRKTEVSVGVARTQQALSVNAGVAEDQPDVYWGGRTQSVAIHPTSNQTIIAATDNGGLFRTTTGGDTDGSWTHLENLIPKEMMDVGFSPGSPNVVIATAVRDTRVRLTPGGATGNAGGIWRSTDGGDNWAPATFNPTPTFTDYAAYGIAFEAGTQNIYVGTDFGLAVSTDDGATFTHVQVNAANRFVQAVAVQNGIIDLVAQGGQHFRATTATAPTFTWTQNTITGASLLHSWGSFATHSVARAPGDDNVIFVAASRGAGYSVFESDDQGATWVDLGPLPQAFAGSNRVPTVAVSPTYGTTSFDVWAGDGVNLYTQACSRVAGTCTAGGASCDCQPGAAWTFINLRSGSRGGPTPFPDPVLVCAKNGGPCEHNDPSHIVFDPTASTTCPADGRPIPLLIAGDGGLMRVEDMDSPTDTCGIRWETIGAGKGGFNALELFQLTGQVHGPGVDTWFYFGTQDNDLWASDSAGSGSGRPWPGNMVFEGFAIDLPHFSATGSPGMVVTAVSCAACGNNYANSDFSAISAWLNPPGANGATQQVFCPDTNTDNACDCVDSNNDTVCEANNTGCTNVGGQIVCQANCIDNDNSGFCDGVVCRDTLAPTGFCDGAGGVGIQVASPRGLNSTMHFQFSNQLTFHPVTGNVQAHLYMTGDAGITWTPVPGAVVPSSIANQTIFQARPTNPTIVVGVPGGTVATVAGLPTTWPIPAGTLATVNVVPTPQPFAVTRNSVSFVDNTHVLGVHPTTPSVMLAATANGLQMTTNAGADNWTANAAGMAQLRTLVTANGAFNYAFTSVTSTSLANGFQVRVVEFDGASNTILVGTENAGIISSLDGGATWARVCDSDNIPRITGFFFDEGCTSAACLGPPNVSRDPQAYAGSYGRGIWQVDPSEQQIPQITSVPPDPMPNDCGPVDIGVGSGTDSCEGLTVQVVAGANASIGDPDFGCAGGARPCGDFQRGPNTVNWTAIDAAGDTSSTTSIVTVNDTTPPIFTEIPQPLSFTTCAGNGEEFTLEVPTAVDTCIGDVVPTGEVIASDSLPVPVPVVNGVVTLPIGTHTIRWTASDGISSASVDQVIVVGPGIYANGELQIRDRVLLSSEDPNDPAGAANAGTVLTVVGDDGSTGSLLSMANVIVDGGTVNGTVTTPATLSTPNGGTVTGGQIVAVPALPPFPTLAGVVFPPPAGGDVTVNSGVTPIPPGSYGNVTVNSGSPVNPKLQLSAGDYYFQRLTSQSASVIEVPPGGVTRIFVSQHIDYRGPFLMSDGSLGEVFVGYTGTDQLTLEAQFLGVLQAPNARLEMGTGNAVEFRGQFFAKTLWVRPGSHLICLSSTELDGTPPADSCFDGTLNGNETGVDCGGNCPPCGTGQGCVVGGDCQSGVCTGGICQAPSCSDGVKNGTETGVDCGGSCAACPPTCNAATYEAEAMFHSTGNASPPGWNIFSNGYISSDHTFTAGPTTVTVRARGSVANGVWPHMVVSVGGTQIGNLFVNSSSYADYNFSYTATAGTREIRVTFDNDLLAPPQDRNLFVDRVVLSCPSATPGLDAVFSAPTSNWPQGYCTTLRVTNTSSVPVSGWTVSLNTNQSTTYTTWNGNFSGTGGVIQVQPQFSWNQTIPPGVTDDSIGFCANRTVSGSGTLPLVISTNPP